MNNPVFTPHSQNPTAAHDFQPESTKEANKQIEEQLLQYLKQVERGEGLAPADSALNQMERNEKRRRDHGKKMKN